MNKTIFTDYYAFLGISQNASTEEIHKAYKEKMKLYHPDMQVGKSEEEQKMAQKNCQITQEAYDTLSNENKKKIYDLEWKRRKQSDAFNEKTHAKTNYTHASNTNQNSYHDSFEGVFDGTFAEYAEFMKAKRRKEKEKFSSSSKGAKTSEKSKKNQNTAFNEYMFHFFKNFADMNFTDTHTNKQTNYKFYRQKTNKTQETKFEWKYANDTSTGYNTFTQDKKEDTEEKKPDFSEIIELDKKLQKAEKEQHDLIGKMDKLNREHTVIVNQLNHLDHYTDISYKVAGNSNYQRAKEYIKNHKQRASKFFTRIFISKKDWNTYYEMTESIQNIEAKAHEEIRNELLEKLDEISKKLDKFRQELLDKEREVSLARVDYKAHPLHFKYECYKMDFTKNYKQNEEQDTHKKVI